MSASAPLLGDRLEVGLLLVERGEVAPLQVAVGRHAREIVAQPRLLLDDLLTVGVELRDLALGLGDRLLQLQDLGQRLARLGVELLGLGEDLDLVRRAVEQAQLLLLGLLLRDLEGLRLVAARKLERNAIVAFADLDALGVGLDQRPARQRGAAR